MRVFVTIGQSRAHVGSNTRKNHAVLRQKLTFLAILRGTVDLTVLFSFQIVVSDCKIVYSSATNPRIRIYGRYRKGTFTSKMLL